MAVLAVLTSELQDGSARIERVRGIEPEDLLGREPVQLDEAGIADLISGKTVLATGAGGAIGSGTLPPGRTLRPRADRPL